MAVTKVGHVALNVTDLDEAVLHYVDVIGLLITARREGEVYLRSPGDQDHHCIVLRQSDRASLASIGLKVGAAGDLEELEVVAGRAGASVGRIAAGEQLGLGEGVRFRLPSGHEVWAYHEVSNIGWPEGMENPDPVSPEETVGSLQADRLDHVAVCAPDIADLSQFLTEVLDFGTSEVVVDDEGRLATSFMYCTNTMHDIAVVPGPEAALHHVAFYGNSRDAVVRGVELLRHRDVPTWDFGLTRHGIAGVTTTYFHDPAGIRNELFYGPYPTAGVPGAVPPVEWQMQDFGRGGFYYENEVDMAFFTTVT